MDGEKASGAGRGSESAWLAGYEAAIGDALAVVEAMGGTLQSFSSPVLMRVRARLAELQTGGRRESA